MSWRTESSSSCAGVKVARRVCIAWSSVRLAVVTYSWVVMEHLKTSAFNLAEIPSPIRWQRLILGELARFELGLQSAVFALINREL